MKPIRLKIKNIGPYVDTDIDFTKLDNLFLITGSTGSGKTFIFDAMSYALYGRASGIRNAFAREKLISDYWNKTDDAFAEFVFSIGDTIYSARRYAEKKTSPKNITFEEKKSVDGGKTFYDCRKGEIEDVIKLTKEEFEKVILLPQGEFQKFLISSTKEKREILARMFPVEKFARIVDEIKSQANEINSQVKNINESIGNVGDGKSVEECRAKEENLSAQIDELHSENEKAKKDCDSQKSMIDALKNEAERAREKENHQKKLEKLESEKSEIDSVSAKITLAKKANPLGEFLRSLESAEKNLSEKNEQKKSLEKSKASKETELSEAERLAEKIPELEKKIKSCIEERQVKANLLVKAKEYESAEKKFAEAEKKFLSAEENLKAAEERLLTAKKNLPEGKSAGDVHVALLGEIQDLKEKISVKKTDAENAKKFEALTEEISCLEKKFSEHSEKKKVAEDEKKSVDAEIEKTELEKELYETNCRAAVLAKKLKVGCRCPVCGSTEHPFPAVEESVKDFSIILENLKKKRSASESSIESLGNDVSKCGQALEIKKEEIKKIDFKKSYADEKSELDDLVSNLSVAEKNAAVAKNLAAEIDGLEEEVSDLKEKKAERKTEFTAAAAEKNAIEKDFDGKNISCTEIEAEIKKIDSDEKAAREEKDDVSGKKESLTKEVSVLSGKLTGLLDEIAHSEKNVLAAEKILSEKLAASEFKDIEEAERNFLSETEIARGEKKIFDWEKSLGEMKAVLNTLSDVRGISEIQKDLDRKNASFMEISEKIRENSLKETEMNQQIGALRKIIEEIEKYEGQKKKLLEKAEIFTYLKEKFAGKTHLDSWALTTYYSEIVQLASRRFNRFSNGQYTFEMNQDFSKGRATSDTSLDIVIKDSSSGGDRDVKNLSGGERFEASISLALAITDSVQNRNGGIELDSIFIDEGFGSLDSATREKVMPIIRELQERKTVGIISHVESFLDEIPSQLHVEKTEKGSVVK